MPAGPVPPNPAALLTQGRFEDLIRYWRTRYDRIIVDGCPYEAVADASLMARHADLVLYLIRCGMIEKQYVPSIQELAARGNSSPSLSSSMPRISRIPVFIITVNIPVQKLPDNAAELIFPFGKPLSSKICSPAFPRIFSYAVP